MRLSPQIGVLEKQHILVQPENYAPQLLTIVFGGFFLGFTVTALVADGTAFRLFMASGALTMLVIAAIAPRFQNAAAQRTVRIDPDIPGLRFVNPASIHVGFFFLGLTGLLPGAVQLLIVGTGDINRSALTPLVIVIVIAVVSLFALGQQLWSLRTPPGLTLTENGIRGVRGTKPVDLRWDELVRAEVVASKGAKLVLHPRNGPAVVIDPRWTGSDPNLVAPITNHFLTHPEHRPTLTDPRAAIRLVEEATRAS